MTPDPNVMSSHIRTSRKAQSAIRKLPLPFEGWVNYIFDHPVLELNWWWQPPESGYLQEWYNSADPMRTLSYLTRLFSDPAGLIDRFTRRQIDQGLNFLVNTACSSHIYVLSNVHLPWADRRACSDAMIPP